ncbi:MAG TPA: hypothetical protein VFI27_22300 [candidate division Zixibacteria bacterium]|nr:hypothetical protein [candidate division Zixibacteria bacterium]
MFTKANSCPICFSAWEEVDGRCAVCGSVAELYYERTLPKRGEVDEEKLEKNIGSVRAYLVDHENHGQARYTLGLSYVNIGLLPEGLVEIKRAAQLLPEKVQIAYEAVAIAAKLGDFSEETLEQINRVIERKTEFKEALYLKGIILRELNRVITAVRSWQDAYKIDPNYKPAYQEIRRFIDENEKWLQNPAIFARLDESSLPKNARDYLDLEYSDDPIKPPLLGETSMKFLEDLWPEKAKVMRQMYADDLRQYEDLMDRRSLIQETLEADIIALSELCLGIYKARMQLKSAVATRTTATPTGSGRLLSIAERSRILDAEVKRYQKDGYSLVARTETTAQLSKEHEFSCCLAVILTFLIIGIILYLLYYLTAKKESLLFLEVNEYGQIKRTHS